MLATCETYISCVKNVCQHLTQEDIGINDMHRVQGELTDSLGTYSYIDSTAQEHTHYSDSTAWEHTHYSDSTAWEHTHYSDGTAWEHTRYSDSTAWEHTHYSDRHHCWLKVLQVIRH